MYSYHAGSFVFYLGAYKFQRLISILLNMIRDGSSEKCDVSSDDYPSSREE